MLCLISSTFQEKCLFRDVKLVWPRCIYPSFLELRGLLGNEKNAGNTFLELSMGIKITTKIFSLSGTRNYEKIFLKGSKPPSPPALPVFFLA